MRLTPEGWWGLAGWVAVGVVLMRGGSLAVDMGPCRAWGYWVGLFLSASDPATSV